MIRVLVESPFAGDVEGNTKYLKKCLLDCLSRGEAPYASHLFFTQFLDDTVPEERTLGITAGLIWGRAAEKTVVYLDRGLTDGMRQGIYAAVAGERPIEYRNIEETQRQEAEL